MAGVTITGSNNIAILDSKIVADQCLGKFFVDLTPSTYIGGGAASILGAKVQITSPYGVVIKAYASSTYDIASPLTAIYEFTIPTQGGNYQYGNYVIEVQITDADGTKYAVSKTVNLCEPNPKDKTKKWGLLSAKITGICKDGKVYVVVDAVPVYKGKTVESVSQSFTFTYPTGSTLDPIVTGRSAFSDLLFEGVYKLVGEICATYNFDDNVYIKVKYKVKKEKDVRCLIDECCVFNKLSELNLKIKSDCSQAEKDNSVNITIDALRLLKTAQLAAECGEDASEYITDLEDLLGCSCSCNCLEGTPVIATPSLANDVVVEGCNIETDVTGTTTTYTINNYAYTVAIVANGGLMTITAPSLVGCEKTQTITFNIAVAYTQIKAIVVADLAAQSLFWASIINVPLNSIDPAGLGLSQDTWNAYTFTQKIAALITNSANCCDCEAAVTLSPTVVHTGADVSISWETEDAESVDIYMDGIFIANLLAAVTGYTIIGAADGNPHTVTLNPLCANGRRGVSDELTFTYIGCPAIAPPSVSSNTVNAACPYNLTTLVAALPAGITAEWHTSNDGRPGTIVGNPAAVADGIYYVFAKNAGGCYSIGIQVTVICTEASACTAPQTLLVTSITGGFLVQFQSAAFPPPLNSYTVKRRLSANPDVDGSYTTIGTPAWNASSGRWEILDATAVNNTLYTYKAISNCGGTTPYATYQFANLTCPAVTATPAEESIAYSFTGVGGQVDKYDVELYSFSGSHFTLIHTDTHVPAFSNPITGTITYLSPDHLYRIKVRVYIGTYSLLCTHTSVSTLEEAATYSFVGGYAALEINVCAATPTVFYSVEPVAPGEAIYYDEALTNPVGTGFIRDESGIIYAITAGVVGAATGAC